MTQNDPIKLGAYESFWPNLYVLVDVDVDVVGTVDVDVGNVDC